MASIVSTLKACLITVSVALIIIMLSNFLSQRFQNSELNVLSARREWDLFPNYGSLNPQHSVDSFISSDFVVKKISELVAIDTFPKSNKHGELVTFKQQDDFTSNYTFILNDLMTAIKVHNFYSSMWGCNMLENPQVKEVLYETSHNLAYVAEIKGRAVIMQIAKADVDELITAKCGSSDADNSKNDLDRCFLLKNKKILQEAVVLMQISHKNVANLVGLCVERTDKSKRPYLSAAGVVLVKESGVPVEMEQLKLSSWTDRLKICFDIVNLIHHFSRVPVGSIKLESWSPSNFILTQQTGTIKLANFDQNLSVNEPFCESDNDCFVNGIECRIPCQLNRCVGYNSKKNLYEVNKSFLSELLRHNVPPEHSELIFNTILPGVKSLSLSPREIASAMQVILPQSHHSFKLVNSLQQKEYNDNPAILSMKKLPDGSQVDSWENHESQVSIIEVPGQFNQISLIAEPNVPAYQQLKPQASQNEPDNFQKIDDADFPGRYDYYCPRSKAEWGCVMSLRTVEEARQKCLEDVKCKAFVTIPHLRKEGWIIAILKSDNTKPVDHAGTTVYIRNTGESKLEVGHAEMVAAAQNTEVHQDCLRDIIDMQVTIRSHYEDMLMTAFGWKGLTDQKWEETVKKCEVVDATTFKPARGKLANGGQMNVNLKIQLKIIPAVFLAKSGPEEYHSMQMAVYRLDRILGLYKTIVSVERRLEEQELSTAGFPVDIGGNQFDKFRPLKQPDNSLTGVVVPKSDSRITVEHYISVPRLSGITSAVTPFSRKQWDDLEYLLLGYLAAIPVPNKGHQSVKGRLVHIKTDDAFLHNTNDYISYLYNCQFPSHVIETLRFSQSHKCNLPAEITSASLEEEYTSVRNILNINVAKLLELVDKCVNKFGESAVLYSTVS